MSAHPAQLGPRVMSAADFQAAMEEKADRKRASTEATRLIEEAEARAAEIIAAAEAEADDVRAGLEKISEQELEKFVNTRALDEVADGLVTMVNEAQKVRRDFDDLKPWLTDLVGQALNRVLGTLPREEVLEQALVNTMAEMRERWDLILRCHPDLAPAFKDIVAHQPELADAIKEIQVDHDLDLDDCLLIGRQGILDVSVTTQVEAFTRALELMVDQDLKAAEAP